MRKKIKEALKQKYGTRANKELGQLQLGLSEEVFERVAASVETFINDESMIETWVNSEATLNLLKSYQGEADRARTDALKSKGDAADKPDAGNKPDNTKSTDDNAGNNGDGNQQDLAAMLGAMLDEKLKPLTDKVAGFEADRAKAATISALDDFINGWDYAKGFKKESEMAKRVALKLYKAGGEIMNGEELIAAYREEFDPAVKEKGVTDFTQPYKGDGEGENDLDFSSFDRAVKKLGWEQGKEAGK